MVGRAVFLFIILTYKFSSDWSEQKKMMQLTFTRRWTYIFAVVTRATGARVRKYDYGLASSVKKSTARLSTTLMTQAERE